MSLPSYNRLKVVEARIEQSNRSRPILIVLAVAILVVLIILIITIALSQRGEQLSQSQTGKKASRILICGGHLHNSLGTYFKTCEYYYPNDPSSNRIISSTMSKPRIWQSSQMIDGKIYIVGGHSETGGSAHTTEIFDVEAETWMEGPELNIGREQIVSVIVNGQIWICGGNSRQTKRHEKSCEVLDLSKNRWILHNTTMLYGRGCTAAAVFDGYLYIFAGFGTGGRLSNKVQRMDITTFKWSEVAPMPYGNDKLAVSTVSDGIVACGGFAGKYHNDCNKYLPKYNTWVSLPPMLQGLEDHILVNFNGKLMVLGGYGTNGGDTRAVEIFNQTTNKWNYGVPLIEKRQAASFVIF